MRLCNGKAGFRTHGIKAGLRGVVAALAVAAGLGAAALPAQAADARFVLISHAPDSDSWWNTIKNAIKQADEDFNVTTDYRNPPNGDIADMS
ncbi:sugar ABC transporter substrate-binding protein, partial [Burkholderia gladioli]|nr:sugar ABC transporter substrate-binding protein [Burkholderia gladioli]